MIGIGDGPKHFWAWGAIEQRGSAAERRPDDSNPFGRKAMSDEGDRCAGVQRFKMPERDARTRAFAMSLKVEQEDRESGRVQQPRTADHAEAIGPNAVHQYDRATARLPGDGPTVQR